MMRRYVSGAAIACALAVSSGVSQARAAVPEETFTVIGMLRPGQGVQTVSIELQPNQEIRTDVYLIIDVSRLSGDGYRIMFGPDPVTVGASTTASATIVQHDYPVAGGTQTVLHMKVTDGAVYMDGSSPYGGTEGGAATSDGSIWMIQRKGSIDRFIYLVEAESGHSLRVHSHTGQKQTVNDVDHFVNVRRSDGAISSPQDIAALPDNHEVRRLIREIAKYADEAKLNVPPDWAPPPPPPAGG